MTPHVRGGIANGNPFPRCWGVGAGPMPLSASAGDEACFFAVTRRGEPWPFLVVVQRYAPAGYGFHPGALIVPEKHRLFLGAGQRLLGYDLSGPARLWEDEANCGFWSWSRYGGVVLMSAELELAAWTDEGQKSWSRFADPPWEYQVQGSAVVVSDLRAVERLDLRTGRRVEAPDGA
jgi:hypothetical protein